MFGLGLIRQFPSIPSTQFRPWISKSHINLAKMCTGGDSISRRLGYQRKSLKYERFSFNRVYRSRSPEVWPPKLWTMKNIWVSLLSVSLALFQYVEAAEESPSGSKCKKIQVRKEWRALSRGEKKAWIDAVNVSTQVSNVNLICSFPITICSASIVDLHQEIWNHPSIRRNMVNSTL